MANIVIFGGSGFIGQNLALNYKRDGERVWLADIVYPTVLALMPHYIGCDIRVPYHVKSILYNLKPDLIINCAGQTSYPLSMAHPASDADVNVLGNIVVFENYRQMCPNTLFIHLSSSTVVGPSSEPIDENTSCHPIDIYSANKLAAETYLSVFQKVYGVNARILRLPNVYGPFGKNDPAYGVLNYWINQAAEGNVIEVYGDGEQARNVLFVADVIEAIKHAPFAPNYPVFVPYPISLKIWDVATMIAGVWDVAVRKIEWPPGRDRIEIGNVVVNTSEFHDSTGWMPKYGLPEGLEATKEIMEMLE